MASVISNQQNQNQLGRRMSLDARSEVGSATSSRLRRLTGVQILATGSYAPEDVVLNEDLAELGCDAEWIVQRTGIHARRHAPDGMATSDMACKAARRCIEAAGVDPQEVDTVIVGTFTSDTIAPSTACRVQHALGLNALAMDVNAACAGFMYAMVTGMQYVASGSSKYALVVGADSLSRIIDPGDKRTYPLFGDAAGAALIGKGDDSQGLLSFTLGSDGSGTDLLCVPGGGSRSPLDAEAIANGQQYLQMDGRAVFKWAIRTVADSIRRVISHSGLTIDDISLVILHQANVRIIDAAAADLGIGREKVVVNLDRYGNTSAGSIPLVLDEVYKAGRIKPGDHIVLCGFGAGLSWGTAVMKW